MSARFIDQTGWTQRSIKSRSGLIGGGCSAHDVHHVNQGFIGINIKKDTIIANSAAPGGGLVLKLNNIPAKDLCAFPAKPQ
jgi:hypothetical protein